jgi:hypothetical protein
MIVDDAAGEIEQVADERVTQRISHGQSLLPRGNDPVGGEFPIVLPRRLNE